MSKQFEHDYSKSHYLSPDNDEAAGEPVTDSDSPLPTNLPLPALQALRWFYERLELNAADEEKLWRDRGLTKPTCIALGFKSNPQSNKELLLEMEQHFPVNVLVDCGLWAVPPSDPTGGAKPNAQFYGMSLVEKRDERGKKVRDKQGKPVIDFVWNNPVLIPYFDEAGELIHIRPHKGMMRDKLPRFYVVRTAKVWRSLRPAPLNGAEAEVALPQYALITEGEFKAAALWQTLSGKVAVAAMPGITLARPLQGDIEEWLSLASVKVRQVVVAYDNEEKGNPKLPGFIEEEWKRYEVTIWARLLARLLGKEGWDARVCVMPKAWQDAKGKADWDGRLAARLDQEHEALQLDGEELWKKCAATLRKEFETVIKTARPVHELFQAGFFDGKAERLIKNRLEYLMYDPKLPVGGEQELAMSRRLMRLGPKLKDRNWFPDRLRSFLHVLAKNYGDLMGGYYTLRPLRDKQEDEWRVMQQQARDRNDHEVVRACEMALKGMPNRITDFYMKAHYVLRRQNGTRQRLVTLHNIHGVNTKLLALPSEPFSTPSKFRPWLLDSITGATWLAGERELQALHADVARDVAYKDVVDVVQRGYHEDSKCWFFGDVTVDANSRELFTEKHGIVWVRTPDARAAEQDEQKELATAYKIADKDHEGQTFRHGEPLLKPAVPATEAEIRELFTKLCEAMFETVGGPGGFMALGAILACGAGPEIYAAYNGFPGLWVHGEPRQGKSSVSRWLMALWGMNVEAGVVLKDSTKVGISIALQQYGNLPVWLEEYQPDAPPWMIEKLKNIYGRESGSKKTFEEGDRKIVATAIVTGVATSQDAQLRSRYVHVQVAEKNRMGNHYDWFEAHRKQFFLIGRYIMRNRKRFAELTLERMKDFLGSEAMQSVDARARIVHGASYAAFGAVAQMLGAEWVINEDENFRKYLAIEARQAVREVDEQVNVNQFWRDLLDAQTGGAFGTTPSELRQVFKLVENPRAKSPVPEEQLRVAAESPYAAFPNYLLYFRPGPAIDMLRAHKRKQGRDLPLERSDLRNQMNTRKYWVPPPKGEETHRQRFEGVTSNTTCWCIDLNKHELGYRPVSDEDFLASFKRDGDMDGLHLPSTEWVDPRKGDLFQLVDALRSKESVEAQ